MRHLKNALGAMLFCAFAGCVQVPPVPDMSGSISVASGGARSTTVPFQFDDNRIFVEVKFVRPDGSEHKALAFVNQGQGGLTLSNKLFLELAPHAGQALHLKIGDMDIAIDGASVIPESLSNTMTISLLPFAHQLTAVESAHGPGGQMAAFAAPLPVEAVIPPGLLEHFQVVFDYAVRTMTLAVPGTLRPEGIAVPIRVNQQTGFANVDVTLAGSPHVFVIDAGGSYSAIRSATPLLAAHPEWLRANGGIGEANLTMQSSDAVAPVLKVRNVTLGALRLDELGALEIGGGNGGWLSAIASDLFWDRIYSAKAGEHVDGILAGNVLKSFRLTIDYPARMSYWLQEAPIDTHDLDQVGVVLGRANGVTTIVGIAQKGGHDTVTGIKLGDKLVKIDGVETSPMLRGQVLTELHGEPGEIKHLTLERDGKTVEVNVLVTAF